MKKDDVEATSRTQDAYTVDYFRSEDAPGIVRLFQDVYGENYPIRLFYDPAAIIAANDEGRYYSIVARMDSGEIAGVGHMFRSAPYSSLYEAGVGLVLKEYRNTGINKEMMRFVYEQFVPKMPNIEETFGEAVCYHPYMQQTMKSFRHVSTAIEVALMPAETYGKEKKTASRVATLNGFRCYKSKPHEVFLPAAYEEILRSIYGRLDDMRELAVAEGELSPAIATRAELNVFDFAGVARIAVRTMGKDFRDCLSELEGQALAKSAVVVQVSLNLAQQSVGEAVAILREKGYFFGGALPRWFDSDGLLMQKLLCPPEFEDIILVSDDAKDLLAFIREDWQRTNSQSSSG